MFIWVCLKIGYIPNYSHLIGIMISKTIGYNGVHDIFRHTHILYNTWENSLRVRAMATTNWFFHRFMRHVTVASEADLRSAEVVRYGKESPFGTRWCPSSLAKLVQITPITMVYGTYNYI